MTKQEACYKRSTRNHNAGTDRWQWNTNTYWKKSWMDVWLLLTFLSNEDSSFANVSVPSSNVSLGRRSYAIFNETISVIMYLFYLSYNMRKDANMLVTNAKFSIRSLTIIGREWWGKRETERDGRNVTEGWGRLKRNLQQSNWKNGSCTDVVAA